jgi:(4S)-4-hydroxy-5-phosphonooxypentane-2,3-dione isomerase
MLIVHVYVHVKPESVEDFTRATVENARASVQEPGIVRFDVVRQQDDSTRFALIEIYRNAEAAAAHKETAHYAKWRDGVAPMMAEPRHSVKYSLVFPDSQG